MAATIPRFTERMIEAGSLPAIFEKAQPGETWLTLVPKVWERARSSIELLPSDGIRKYGYEIYYRWFRGDERLPLGYLDPKDNGDLPERLTQELACHPTRLSKNTMEVTATNAVSQLVREAQEGPFYEARMYGFLRLLNLHLRFFPSAWPASLVRQIGFSPDLNRRALIERALEVYRKRHCLPG